ncbi:MAG: nucleotidyltransferase domain-containing protein [Bacteroidia bacterium]|nr:nucleotidyltransferase domain-containing protein [Bacteroidia bacterium]
MPHGLKESTMQRITEVLSGHSQIDQVVLYGSRAMGNFKNGSDIDMTIKGDALTLKDLNRIAIELDDLLLPYEIDLSLYNHIDNQALLEHIERVGKVIYKR